MSPVLMGKAESCGERAAMVEGGERVMVDGDEREVKGRWERARAAMSVEVVAPVNEGEREDALNIIQPPSRWILNSRDVFIPACQHCSLRDGSAACSNLTFEV